MQGLTRIATTVDTLLASAVFFHGRAVVVQQKVITEGDLTRLAESPKPVYVFWRQRPSREEGEIRGDFWDLGRIEQRDGRFAGYDFARLVETVNRGQWPGRDQIYVLLGASLLPAEPPRAPSLRAIALAPDNYVEREVRVIGRFRGRNLYGELPFALGKGKWDFVLQSAEGALWVTGVRPRGKGFDLDPSKRVDTGRWVEVTAIVKRQGVTTYLEATAIGIASAPEETAVEVTVPVRPREPPPEVIFSAPVSNDQDVEPGAPVRIQFSRDVDPRTIKGRVAVSYVAPPGGAAARTPPSFTATYNDVAHAVEIRFAQPLERFQQVKVELLEGITALDGQALKPWTLTFATGK
ncbi:MAG TPA: Ig-like domain-containing protein [Vicinamibacterales bacterium]|nr:Ig-like domain-containing protein [Vicinamibacterales bacterium]